MSWKGNARIRYWKFVQILLFVVVVCRKSSSQATHLGEVEHPLAAKSSLRRHGHISSTPSRRRTTTLNYKTKGKSPTCANHSRSQNQAISFFWFNLLELMGVDLERPVLNVSPFPLSVQLATLGVKDILQCQRVQVSGLSRLKVGSYASSFHITLAPSAVIPEVIKQNPGLFPHVSAYLGYAVHNNLYHLLVVTLPLSVWCTLSSRIQQIQLAKVCQDCHFLHTKHVGIIRLNGASVKRVNGDLECCYVTL